MLKTILFLLIAQTEPQWELLLDPGATMSGAHRANIIGATHLFSSVPTTPTCTIQDITYRFVAGDRICVNDATFAYIYDGSNWRSLLTSVGSGTTIILADRIVTTKTTQYFVGNNSYDVVLLDHPAFDTTLEIHLITSPHISDAMEWIEGVNWSSVKNASGYITSVSPEIKWFKMVSTDMWSRVGLTGNFRLRYVRAD